METKVIAVINGQQIQVIDDEQPLVPIKPICQALGVAYESQVNKIKEHPILRAAAKQWVAVDADGKEREMFCLPLEYVFGWLFLINPIIIREGVHENITRYQEACSHALSQYFTQEPQRVHELLEAGIALLKERDEVAQNLADVKEEATRLKGLLNDIDGKLIKIRDERHNPQPLLFD